ncbi:MAG: hypothetical protein HOE90_11025 [Bacteriovoracaceae bacterium]|jgi:V8-like Glu-specific endopeptidase|nr:hypothetical protein [Bacteriovoracaceae bacterium]
MVLVLILLKATLAVSGMPQIIYGDDDRVEIYRASNAYTRLYSHSVASKIDSDSLTPHLSFIKKLDVLSLADNWNLCPEVRFKDQPAAGKCSAFMIGKDLMATAGHCMRDQYSCDNSTWVFNYRKDFSYGGNYWFLESDIYKCSRLEFVVSPGPAFHLDLAIFRLDRAPRYGAKFELSQKGGEDVDVSKLALLGFPLGAPMKAIEHVAAHVGPAGWGEEFFHLSVDTFVMNSGSPVFNKKTGILEGILVAGGTDFKWDDERGCRVENHCLDGDCRGESILKGSYLHQIMKKNGLY